MKISIMPLPSEMEPSRLIKEGAASTDKAKGWGTPGAERTPRPVALLFKGRLEVSGLRKSWSLV